MKWKKNYPIYLILIIFFVLLVMPHNSTGVVTDSGPGVPPILYLLLEEGIQPVTDYDNDSFNSSIDCNDQATSCTTDCTDSDGDAVPDCLDLCIDNDLDGYGIDNSATIIGNGSVSVVDCTVFGSDPCILTKECYDGSDCDDGDGGINPGATELCDGLDNDCNVGTIDGSGETTPANDMQEGVCAGSYKICSGIGGWINNYADLSSYEATETSCDGLDNDCDGETDEIDCGNSFVSTRSTGMKALSTLHE